MQELEIGLLGASQFQDSLANWKKQEFDSLKLQDDKMIVARYFKRGFEFDMNRNRLESILPSEVLQSKQGSCLGNSLLLLLANEGNFKAVLLPDHLILKGDASQQFYEMNRSGFIYSRVEYERKYKNKKWTGWEFRELSIAQLKGIVLFQIANALAAEENKSALEYYKEAKVYFSDYLPIKENEHYYRDRLK